jgi:hypothetical protein
VRNSNRGAVAPKPKRATIVGRLTPHHAFAVWAFERKWLSTILKSMRNVVVDPESDAFGHGMSNPQNQSRPDTLVPGLPEPVPAY